MCFQKGAAMRTTKHKVNQYKLLHLLRRSKPDDRQTILYFLDDAGLHTLGEFTHNCLFRRCNLTPEEKDKLIDKLKPQAKSYEKIAKKNLSNKVRKRLIQEQSGSGLLTTLLTVGLPLLTSFLWPSKKK